jgi:hypothetical protein
MDTELDNKITKFFGGSSLEVVKFVSKDPNYKYYEMKDGTRIAIENEESEEEEEVKKVEIAKKKRPQSEGNKKWWDFVKEFEKRPEMAGKSRNFIVQAAKKPYHESKR